MSIGSLFGITEATVPTVVVVLLLLSVLFRMIMISTDYYPNVTLTLLGWRGVLGQQKSSNTDAVAWIFYRANHRLKTNNGTVNVRFFGSVKSGLKLGEIDNG